MNAEIPSYQETFEAVKNHPKRREFFQKYVFDLMDEMRLSIRGGRLWKDRTDSSSFEGWRSTPKHELVVSLGVDVFTEICNFSDEDRLRGKRAAAGHDWRKRFEREKREPNTEEQAVIDRSLVRSKSVLDENLLIATGPKFQEMLEHGNPTILEKVVFYMDNIARGSDIVLLEDRINEARTRNPDHDWDKELSLSRKVEIELTDLANKNGANIQNPQDLPIFILQRIKERFDTLN